MTRALNALLGGVAILAATVALIAIVACPVPKPPVNPTPDADASVASSPTCVNACRHADEVCPDAGPVCETRCNKIRAIDSGYTVCIMAAKECRDLNCDAVSRAGRAGGGTPILHGR